MSDESLEVQIDESEFDADGNYIGDDPDMKENQQGEGGDENLLAGKYKDVGDLEKAYLEAQQRLTKLSQGKGEADDSSDTPSSHDDGKIGSQNDESESADADSVSLDTALEDIQRDGKIADKTLEALEAKGISKAQVENYVRGTTELGNHLVSELQDTVGGEESFNALLDWAGQNLSDAEIAAYDQAIDDGNPAMAKMLLRGMKSTYDATMGQDPDLVGGENTPRTSGVKPFGNEDMIVKAMGDERYETDPDYTRKVNERLAATEWF